MRSALHATLVSILGFCLGFSSPVEAQVGAKESSVAPETRDRGVTKPATGTQSSNEANATPGTVETKGERSSSDAASPKDAKEKGSRSDAGGYTWSEKKPVATVKKAHVTRRIDPERPLAEAPNFEMRADGSSVVTLSISRTTEINQRAMGPGKSKGRVVVFQMKQVQIGIRNNTNPLITEHFQTPLRRVVLRREGKGAILRLEFRDDVQITHAVKAGPHGSVLVEIAIPKPTRVYSSPATRRPETSDSRHNSNAASDAPSNDERRGNAPGPNP